jgi:Lar family restriction alleviation protein
MSERELLPCPFCGGDSIECHPNDIARYGHNMAGATTADLHYSHCNGCGAEGPGAHSYQEAVDLHNRRAPSRQSILEEAIQAVVMSARKYHGDDFISTSMDAGATHQLKVSLEAIRSLAQSENAG